LSRSQWITVAIVAGCIIAAAVAIYFIYTWYLANYGQLSDSDNNVSDMNGKDYRGLDEVWGIKDNNPFNLIYTNQPWHGKVTPQQGKFEVFMNLLYGLRAGLMSCVSRLHANGNTIRRYIAGVPDGSGNLVMGYAPAADGNDTETYIRNICNALGVGPDDQVTLNAASLLKLGWAHVEQENGYDKAHQYIDDNDFRAAISMITDGLGRPIYT
jgi:hypothetical protein